MKIILKISVFLSMLIILTMCVILPQFNMNYNASIIDKYDRLMSINEPKIILAGSSGTAFGIDSEQIENAFKMPVVNLGLHAGLGETIHSEIAKENINEGDIVILIPQNYSNENKIYDHTLAWITIENHLYLWKCIGVNDYKGMVEAFPTYLKKCLNHWITNTGNAPNDTGYSRTAFNKYGDNIFPRPGNIISDETMESLNYGFLSLNEDYKNYCNEYNSFVKSKGAVLFMTYPSILKSDIGPTFEETSNIQSSLLEKLDFPLISDVEDYVFDSKYFYDSTTHLNDQGKELRTQILINDLSKYLEKK